MQTTKYIFTSVHFTGAVQFAYDNSGLMVFYSVLDAGLTRAELIGLLKKMPMQEKDLTALNQTGYFTVKKVVEDLSFDGFWGQYNKKIHAHRCEPLWKKLSDVKKLEALNSIAAYDNYTILTRVAKANPENYLKKEYWKTDWSKEV